LADKADPLARPAAGCQRDEDFLEPGQRRVDRIAALAAVGLDRIICFPTKLDPTEAAQERFAEDCVAAGASLG
jgi:hypothetical protein